MSTQQLIIRLYPKDKFFFGESTPFVELEKDDSQFYLRKSALYPQQTALLGMLQKQLLLQNACLSYDSKGNELVSELDRAKLLIGERSFFPSDSENTTLDLGIIKRLSPVYVIEKGNPSVLSEEVPDYQGFSSKNGRFCFDQHQILSDVELPNLSSVKEATEFKQRFTVFDEATQEYYAENIASIKHLPLELGISKPNTEGALTDDGFYKNQFARFATTQTNEYGFAFAIELSTDQPFALSSGHVRLGKETNVTSFRMEVQPSTSSEDFEGFFSTPAIIQTTTQIRLCSDAFLPNDILPYCQGAITEPSYFKTIQRPTQQVMVGFSQRQLSNMYVMYRRGSVFCLRRDLDPTAITQINSAMNQVRFQQIGYNHYKLD